VGTLQVKGEGKDARSAYEFLLGRKTSASFEEIGKVSSEKDMGAVAIASFDRGNMVPGRVYYVELDRPGKDKRFLFLARS
jgi:hypothetical protein